MKTPRRACVTLCALILAASWAPTLPGQELEMGEERVEVGVRAVPSRLDLLEESAPPPFVAQGVIPVEEQPAPTVARPGLPEPIPAGVIQTGGAGISASGEVGGGSGNTVIGSFELSRYGQGPEFRVAYGQERSDGGWFHGPGAGFLRQENSLETWLSVGSEKWKIEGSGQYESSQNGLQGKSTYYAADVRSVGGAGTFRWSPSETLGLFGRIESNDVRQVISVSESNLEAPTDSRSSVLPAIGLDVTLPRATLGFGVRYRGDFFSGSPREDSHRVAGYAESEFVLRRGLRLGVGGETAYFARYGTFFPAWLSLEADFAQTFSTTLTTRYEVETSQTDMFWDYLSATAVDRDLEPQRVVSGNAKFEWRIKPERLSIVGDFSVRDKTGVLEPESFESALGVFSLLPEDRLEVESNVSGHVSIAGWTALARWKQQWGEYSALQAETSGELEIAYGSDRARFSASGSMRVFDDLATPRVDLGSDLFVTPNVTVRLFAEDLVSIATGDEYTVYGAPVSARDPFSATGPRIGATVAVRF